MRPAKRIEGIAGVYVQTQYVSFGRGQNRIDVDEVGLEVIDAEPCPPSLVENRDAEQRDRQQRQGRGPAPLVCAL